MSNNEDPNDTPMMRRLRHPLTPKSKYKEPPYENKSLEFSLYEGFTDSTGFALLNDDYYGIMGALGFYDNTKLPKRGPLTHDTDTTTSLHYYDTSRKKTPIDKREDTNLNLSQVAQDYSNSELYEIQDFSEASARRIKEKTHRILNDPIRKLQSQLLIDIQEMKGKLQDPRAKIHPIDKLVAYSSMLLNVNTILLERMTDVLDYQEKIFMFNKYETKPKAQLFYCEMTLTDGAEATKIDFSDAKYNLNIPLNAKIYDFPSHNLLSLQIIFDSGTNLFISTNKPANSLETTLKLNSPPQEYTVTPGQFSIKSLNMRAQGSDSVVRIIGLY
jgi:hypothetical protein